MNKKIKEIFKNKKIKTCFGIGMSIIFSSIMLSVSLQKELCDNTDIYYMSNINNDKIYKLEEIPISIIDTANIDILQYNTIPSVSIEPIVTDTVLEEVPTYEVVEENSIDILEEQIVSESNIVNPQVVTEDIESEMLSAAWSDKVQLSMEEFYMICNTVYYEARGCTPQEQAMVALTILNRVNSDSFPNTVYEVLISPNQYDPKYTDYSLFIWSEEIEQSVMYALECNDYHPDMVYYRADHYFTGSFQIPYMHIGGCWFSIQNK